MTFIDVNQGGAEYRQAGIGCLMRPALLESASLERPRRLVSRKAPYVPSRNFRAFALVLVLALPAAGVGNPAQAQPLTKSQADTLAAYNTFTSSNAIDNCDLYTLAQFGQDLTINRWFLSEIGKARSN